MASRLSKKVIINSGQNGVGVDRGIAAFSSTDATVDIVVNLRNVDAVSITWIGTPAADENASVDETVSGTAGTADAKINGSTTDGTTTLTVRRTGAAKTSGQKFSWVAYGQP